MGVERFEHPPRALVDLGVREAQQRVSGGLQRLLFARVVQLRSGSAVLGSVDLDGELEVRPAEVDLEAFEVAC